jgi:hypothetical protein
MNLMDKYMNTKNNLQRSRQNPCILHEISLHDVKVHVLYIPHVRKITGSVLYAEIIISESRRYCTGASKTAPYIVLLKLTTVRKVATDMTYGKGHDLAQQPNSLPVLQQAEYLFSECL